MSRRKERAGIEYGQLVLQCPHGHTLGALLLKRNVVYRLKEPLRDNKEEAGEVLPVGEKVKAQCPACRADGLRPDYQASWEKTMPLLQVEHDTPSEQRILKLG